ncbi:MAG: right-handed parallel beta-helix repeat-containing protein [Bdellovibrionota bacterium]
MFQKVLVYITAGSMFAAQVAQATCHAPGLYEARSIRRALENSGARLSAAPTLIPSPTAPQNLGELHDRMNDALIFALSRDQTLPSFTLGATNADGANNSHTFASATVVGIPTSIQSPSGHPTLDKVRVRYLSEGGINATCYYKAAVGGYAFDYCTHTALEPICDKGWAGACKASMNLGINAGDVVIARAVQLPLASCGRGCAGTESIQAVFPNVNSACGGLAKTNVHLLQNLVCSDPNHVALEVWGAKNVVEGHGFAVKSAGSEIGLFISGDDTAVRNIDVSGVSGGYGMMAYDTNGLRVTSSRFRSNLVGANIYTDSVNTTNVQVLGNDMSGNAFSALIFSGDSKQTDNPIITGNNFANTGGYAVAIDAVNATFSGSQNNIYTGSKDALYLSNGNFTVSSLDLSQSGAVGPQIFVDSAKSLNVSNTNLTYTATAQQSQERTALHLYRVANVNISKLTVTNSDVAFKATTEMGTSPNVTVTGSTFTNATTAAIMLQSWDNTAFGTVTITGNVLTGAPAGYAIWQVGSTAFGAGSVLTGNTQ